VTYKGEGNWSFG